MGGSNDNRQKHQSGYPTIRCTFVLRIYRVRSRVANIPTGTFDFVFLHWTASAAVSFLCLQLAAGEPLFTSSVQTLQNTINSSATVLQTQATAVTQQTQAAANATIQNVTSQAQAALKSTQQLASTLDITYEQAQSCLIQKGTSLLAIVNSSRK